MPQAVLGIILRVCVLMSRIVLDVVAQMRDQPAAEVANATFDNTCQLFSKL